ncbi:MAG: F0F1 ATP synthase subunit epsilon [Phycisphaerales bacterium]|nr:F0F1 ATP synthase subunit epsilon [Phycisphaerales bacterium]
MSTSFRCAVMTPEGASFDGEVTYASFPAWDGQYGVMAGMAPVLDRLGIGHLRLDTAKGTRWFSVEEGFAHVRDNTLTILSEAVHALEDLSIGELESALKAFESADHSDLSADEQNSQRIRMTSKLRLAQTHRGDRVA